MDIEHPAAQMIVEVAKSQEEETGDGTTTAVVLAGQLLARAEDLLENDVHPTVIANGYRFAAAEARTVLEGMAAPADDARLREVARTAMTGKAAESARDLLADLVVGAVSAVREEDGSIDLDDVSIETAVGGGVDDASLVEGVVLDKERVKEGMPRWVEDARVLVCDVPLEIRETDVSAELNVTTPEQFQQFVEREEAEIRGLVEAIVESGANVVVCQKGIDDLAQHYLTKAGVFAIRRAKKSDVRALARATGARVLSDLSEFSAEDLGHAGLVEEREIGEETLTFIEGCENPKSVSLLLRGGTEHVVREVERAVEDAMGVARVTLLDELVLPGGGASEIELAAALRDFADGVEGREQLAVEAFADAMEVIPRTLAENAGLDSIDSLVALRARHDAGETSAGLDAYTGEVIDMYELEVVEPLRVKTHAIEAATEAVELMLRIDDVIAADLREDDADVDF
jgi:thermosome